MTEVFHLGMAIFGDEMAKSGYTQSGLYRSKLLSALGLAEETTKWHTGYPILV